MPYPLTRTKRFAVNPSGKAKPIKRVKIQHKFMEIRRRIEMLEEQREFDKKWTP